MQKVIWALLALALVLFVLLDQGLITDSAQQIADKETDGREFSETIISSQCLVSKKACSVELTEGSAFEITSSLDVIRALEPVDIQVKLSHQDKSKSIRGLKLYFSGREMDMGEHYLIPHDAIDLQDGRLAFQGMIPVCSVDPKMAWTLIVSFRLNDEKFVIVNPLQTSVEH